MAPKVELWLVPPNSIIKPTTFGPHTVCRLRLVAAVVCEVPQNRPKAEWAENSPGPTSEPERVPNHLVAHAHGLKSAWYDEWLANGT